MSKRAIKQRLGRQASKAIVGGMKPPEDPFMSWFGQVRVGHPSEEWPRFDGKPLMPLCQLNLTEAPHKPDSLSDIALISVFIAGDDGGLPSNTPNGEHWELRAYTSLDGLVEIPPPNRKWPIRTLPIRWELIDEDFPTWDYAVDLDIPEEFEDEYSEIFVNVEGTKIGGWPSTIQSEIFWAPDNAHPANPEYVFQINSEAKGHWMWGDGGCGYFGRGTGEHRHIWTIEWQCY